MISRREFLQATAAAAAIATASGLGPLGRAAAQQKLSQADILRFDPLGTVTILHVTDIHAQLLLPLIAPTWFAMLLFVGLLLAFAALVRESLKTLSIPSRLVCRGPPVLA